jgi:hypothetical protein
MLDTPLEPEVLCFFKLEADGIWWSSRSSKPLAADNAAAGSIPASSGIFPVVQ